jgi:chaperonin cofactor prefoldin
MDFVVVAFIMESVLFLAGLFKVYTDMQVHFKEIDVRLKAVERQDDEIYEKLDRIMEKLSQMDVKMENKANR